MKKFIKLFNRNFINYIAIIISALTLIAFIYQTAVISNQQEMSVYPHLMLTNVNGGSLKYSYILTNKGVGPAIIENVLITVSNGKMYDDLGLYLLDTIPEKYHNDFLITNIVKGQLISPGDRLELMALNDKSGFEINQDSSEIKTKVKPIILSNKLYTLINDQNFFLEIEYKSVYGDKWKIDNKTIIPKEL